MQKGLVILLFSISCYGFDTNYTAFDMAQSHQQHIDSIRYLLDNARIEDVSFPVAQSFDSSKTFIRKGLLKVRANAIGTVIICHGYTHSKYEGFFFKMLFPHFNVLAFDFRAHGEQTCGQYSTIGRDEILDVKGAVDYVNSRLDLSGVPLFGFGFSMGAVSLFQAQSHYKNLFDALILDSPFDSSDDCMKRSIDKAMSFKMWGKTYKIPGSGLILKALYNPYLRPIIKYIFKWTTGMDPNTADTKFVPVIPLKNAQNIKIPCMFVTCEKDASVTVDCVHRLYQAIDVPFKRLWITKGIKHCGSCLFQPEAYCYRVNKFIKHVLDHSFEHKAKVYDDRKCQC